MTVSVVELESDRFAALGEDVLDVYAEAMQVAPEVAQCRRSILSSHLRYGGLRAVAAFDDERLVGIGYGYVGAAGQWWHDQVRSALSEHDVTGWLDGAFEVCELHVRPAYQGTGLGRQLLARLLSGAAVRTAILTTPDLETRARHFYRAGGWVDLAQGLRFPGDTRVFAVLGLSVASPGPS
ncbi:MAG: GNAT family N-acetyltransferase [Mycobacteriales bacterium]